MHSFITIVLEIVIFMFFFENRKFSCFVKKNRSASPYVCVLICPKSSRNSSRKISISRERLVIENCLTPRRIACLMFYRLMYNVPSHSIAV